MKVDRNERFIQWGLKFLEHHEALLTYDEKKFLHHFKTYLDDLSVEDLFYFGKLCGEVSKRNVESM